MTKPLSYAWKEKSRHSVPAQVAGLEIERIRAERGEFFTPSDVVQEARAEDAPLHPEFEWDDQKAADRFRVDQAGYLIRSIVIVSDQPEQEPIRAFVSISDDDGYRYTSISRAFSHPDMRENVLSQAASDLRAFERKYSRFMDLTKVIVEFQRSAAKAKPKLEKMAAE